MRPAVRIYILFRKIVEVSGPEPKSIFPETILKKRHPRLNISDLGPIGNPLSNSGETYPGVPHLYERSLVSVLRHARPKSAMHTLSSSLSRMRMLSGFRSLWYIPYYCIRWTVSINCAIIVRTYSSLRRFY